MDTNPNGAMQVGRASPRAGIPSSNYCCLHGVHIGRPQGLHSGILSVPDFKSASTSAKYVSRIRRMHSTLESSGASANELASRSKGLIRPSVWVNSVGSGHGRRMVEILSFGSAAKEREADARELFLLQPQPFRALAGVGSQPRLQDFKNPAPSPP